MKTLPLLLVILTATGCGENKPKLAEKQCRVLVDGPGVGTIYVGDWESCSVADKVSEGIYNRIQLYDAVIWMQEQIPEGKGWSLPAQHGQPKTVPGDYTASWDEI